MTDSTLEIGDAIVTALRTDGTVVALVGQRTYDDAPQNPTFPLIELGNSFGDPWEGHEMDGFECRQLIRVWSEKPGKAQAKQIAAAVKDRLHRGTLTLGTQSFVLGNLMSSNVIKQSDGITTLVAMRFQFLTHP